LLFSTLMAVPGTLLWASGSMAQSDYRNLDTGRPIAIEDAQPIEFRAFEFQVGIPRYSRGDRDWELSFEPEIKWGIAKDWQFGISGENATLQNGRTTNSFRDTQFHLLYNLNQESLTLPSSAFRPEVTLGTGALGSQSEHAALKAIVSRSFGMNRLHLNGSYTIGPTEAPGRGGGLVNRYLYGIAYERTFPIEFLVLLADLYALKPIDGSSTEINVDLGTRLQLIPTLVLDAGIFTGAIKDGPDIGFTIGLSYVFSFRGLFPTQGARGGLL
ncbi:MAG: hypothetical protein ACREIQ_09185, partial [Nitrospiria bacterium]